MKKDRLIKVLGIFLLAFLTACQSVEQANENTENSTYEIEESVSEVQESSEETSDNSSEETESRESSFENNESEPGENISEESSSESEQENAQELTDFSYPIQSVPEDQDYIIINDNVPFFSNEELTSDELFESYGSLDNLGRVTGANALLGFEMMPSEDREDISHIEPSGWNQARYAGVSAGGWLYNRSHLIGFQLTGENANPRNLMTGTRWFNEQMIPFENTVADYIETTENRVRYRITPVFEGDNLLASGVYMEAFSIEDIGSGVMFNIYIPNRQPGVEINYADGSSVGPEGPATDGEIADLTGQQTESSSEPSAPAPETESEPLIKGNINSEGERIYHVPGGAYYEQTVISEPGEQMFQTAEEAETAGFRKSQR